MYLPVGRRTQITNLLCSKLYRRHFAWASLDKPICSLINWCCLSWWAELKLRSYLALACPTSWCSPWWFTFPLNIWVNPSAWLVHHGQDIFQSNHLLVVSNSSWVGLFSDSMQLKIGKMNYYAEHDVPEYLGSLGEQTSSILDSQQFQSPSEFTVSIVVRLSIVWYDRYLCII